MVYKKEFDFVLSGIDDLTLSRNKNDLIENDSLTEHEQMIGNELQEQKHIFNGLNDMFKLLNNECLDNIITHLDLEIEKAINLSSLSEEAKRFNFYYLDNLMAVKNLAVSTLLNREEQKVKKVQIIGLLNRK